MLSKKLFLNIVMVLALAVSAKAQDDDIILISDNGVIIRIQASSISCYSRYSKGVIVMKMDDDSKIATISRAPHEESEE